MSEQNPIVPKDDDIKALDASYWESRWKDKRTGWDIGHASPPIMTYMQTYHDKEASILIPGCGNAYEAALLVDLGFTNITVVDISPTALVMAKEKVKNQNTINFICADFFSLNGSYDLILEQTFFCAIPRSMREEYARQSADLLVRRGRLVGVLFDREFSKEEPPYGGTSSEYMGIFKAHYQFEHFESCYNSIAARNGTELFINLIKK